MGSQSSREEQKLQVVGDQSPRMTHVTYVMTDGDIGALYVDQDRYFVGHDDEIWPRKMLNVFLNYGSVESLEVEYVTYVERDPVDYRIRDVFPETIGELRNHDSFELSE